MRKCSRPTLIPWKSTSLLPLEALKDRVGRSSRTVLNLMTRMSLSVGLDTVAFKTTSDDLNESAIGTTETVRESAALGAASATALSARAERILNDIMVVRTMSRGEMMGGIVKRSLPFYTSARTQQRRVRCRQRNSQ